MIDVSWKEGSIMVWQKVCNVFFCCIGERCSRWERLQYQFNMDLSTVLDYHEGGAIWGESGSFQQVQSQNVVKLSVNSIKNWQAVVITFKVAMREPKRKSIFIYHLPVPVEGGKNKIPFPQYSQYTSLLDSVCKGYVGGSWHRSNLKVLVAWYVYVLITT